MDEKQRYRIDKQVRKIITSFEQDSVTVSEAMTVVLSIINTLVNGGPQGDGAVTTAGRQVIVEELEHFLTYLRTGVMPERGNGVAATEH